MSTTSPGPLSAGTITTTTTGTGAYTLNPSALGSGYTISSAAGLDFSDTSVFSSPVMTVEQTGRLDLKGKSADVVINGVSLTDTLKAIHERLNILIVNQKLEAEWDQLRELGEKYRQLEAELLEKQRMWEIMKK